MKSTNYEVPQSEFFHSGPFTLTLAKDLKKSAIEILQAEKKLHKRLIKRLSHDLEVSGGLSRSAWRLHHNICMQ
jgi:hypothetical protein